VKEKRGRGWEKIKKKIENGIVVKQKPITFEKAKPKKEVV